MMRFGRALIAVLCLAACCAAGALDGEWRYEKM